MHERKNCRVKPYLRYLRKERKIRSTVTHYNLVFKFSERKFSPRIGHNYDVIQRSTSRRKSSFSVEISNKNKIWNVETGKREDDERLLLQSVEWCRTVDNNSAKIVREFRRNLVVVKQKRISAVKSFWGSNLDPISENRLYVRQRANISECLDPWPGDSYASHGQVQVQ